MPTIVGIDPGLAATGIGIVRGSGLSVDSYSYGAITTSKEKPLPQRLDKIFTRLLHLLEDTKPDIMVVEDVFSLEKYPKSGIVLGKVSGIILLAGCRAGVHTCEVPVREAKQILTGNGNAGKKQLEMAVRHTLEMATPIRPYHASDALGLALIGLFRYSSLIG